MKQPFLKLLLSLAVISVVSLSTYIFAVQARGTQKQVNLLASQNSVSQKNPNHIMTAPPADCPHQLTRDAKPNWMTATLDDYTVSIPYSDEWQVSPGNCGYNVYQHGPFLYKVGVHQYVDPKQHVLFFGRPAYETGDVIPEYQIYRAPFVPETMDILLTERLDPMPNGCGIFDKMPVEMSVGGKKGYKYFTGGAKWCALVFQFNQGKYVYTVQRDLEPSYFSPLERKDVTEFRKALDKAGPPGIDLEMKKIIESIKE